MPEIETYSFKCVDDLELMIDAYTPEKTNAGAVLYYHGGGGILGSRKDVIEMKWYLERGYTFLSPDYRLAPEASLAQLVEDAEDAYAWLIEKGTKLLGIKPDQIAIAGFSFGGYLAQLLAVRLSPKPVCALSFSGYGDLLGCMYTQPSLYYIQTQPAYTQAYVLEQRSRYPLAVPDGKDRLAIYYHARQTGTWNQLVCHLDPNDDVGSILPDCPVRMMTKDASPVFLVHGTEDMDVSYHQALLTESMLRALGVDCELISLPCGHGVYGKGADEAMARSADFVDRHMKAASLREPSIQI